MRRIWMLFFWIVFTLMLMMSICLAADDNELTVSGGVIGTDYTYSAGVLTFLKGGTYTVGMASGTVTTTHQIRVNITDIYNDTKSITLILSGINMERTGDYNVYYDESSTEHISGTVNVNIILEGNNFITNNSTSGRCIKVDRNVMNTTVSGSGNLTLNSQNKDDEWSSCSFTMEGGKITSNNVGFSATSGAGLFFMKAGELHIDSSECCIYTSGELYMTGGTLYANNQASESCIYVAEAQPRNKGTGLQISGGTVTLESSGSGSGKPAMMSLKCAQSEKDILITGENTTVTINGHGNRLAGIGLFSSGNDFKIENGKLQIEGCKDGIYIDDNISSTITFNGGETEITAKDDALYHATDLSFSNTYKHKSYIGMTASGRVAVPDSSIVYGTGNTYPYLLIAPVNSITYQLNYGTVSDGNPTVYSHADLPLKLNNPKRTDYQFTGWTGSNGTTPEIDLTIPTGTTGDLEYTANWEKISYYVKITAGEGMTKTENSGSATQTGLTGAMQPVVYVADEEYYFHQNYTPVYAYGISIVRDSYTHITISGTPTTNVDFKLVDATKKKREDTPKAVFTANGPDSGTLTKAAKGMKYSLDGGKTWTDTAGYSVAIDSGVTVANGIQVYYPASDIHTRLDSRVQTIDVSKAQTPTTPIASGCTVPENNNGTLSGMTAEMEYRRADENSWTSGTGGAITGLTPGIYLVRVRAEGATLASDALELTVSSYQDLEEVETPSFSLQAGTYSGSQSVIISCETAGAMIYYSTDGSIPSRNSPRYPGPLSISESTTLRAIAVRDGMRDSGMAEVTYIIRPGGTVSAAGYTGVYDGNAHGITVSVTGASGSLTIRYGTGEGSYPLTASPTITNVADSPLTVWYQVTGDGFETTTGSATVTITGANPAVTPPTSGTLTENGQAQALLNAGSAIGGMMVYAIGSDAVTPPAVDQFTASIPVGTEAGTYYVWYRVMGDGNHLDSEPVALTVLISASPTPEPTPTPTPSPTPVVEGELWPELRSGGKTALDLSWTQMKNVDGYDIFMTLCDTWNYKLIQSLPADAKSYTITNLKKGVPYKMYIRAWVSEGGVKNYAERSITVHAYTNNGNGEETNPKDIRLKTKAIKVTVGEKKRISARLIGAVRGLPILSHDGAFRYLVSDGSIAAVSDDGEVTGKQEGTCTVRVFSTNGLYKTVNVTVEKAEELRSISFPKKQYSVKVGKTLNLGKKLKRTPAGTTATFTWKSSRKKIATVSMDGVVTAKKKGTTIITVSTKNGLKAKVKVKVKAK